MKTLTRFGLASLLAGLIAISLGALASPVSAQGLEDAFRRAQESKGGNGGNGGNSAPPQNRPAPPRLGDNFAGPSGGGNNGGNVGSPSPRLWGALAASIWKRNGVPQVAVGSAIKFKTKSEAERAALRQCRSAGGRTCKVASTWSRGCGYITTGRNRRGAGWVARATRGKTLSDCWAKGYKCKAPIGGCVN